ncbi:hypothetical protein [Parasphingorhabdus pacifica]
MVQAYRSADDAHSYANSAYSAADQARADALAAGLDAQAAATAADQARQEEIALRAQEFQDSRQDWSGDVTDADIELVAHDLTISEECIEKLAVVTFLNECTRIALEESRQEHAKIDEAVQEALEEQKPSWGKWALKTSATTSVSGAVGGLVGGTVLFGAAALPSAGVGAIAGAGAGFVNSFIIC